MVNNKENKIDMDKHDKSENSGYKPSPEFINQFKPLIIGAGHPERITIESVARQLQQRIKDLEDAIKSNHIVISELESEVKALKKETERLCAKAFDAGGNRIFYLTFEEWKQKYLPADKLQ